MRQVTLMKKLLFFDIDGTLVDFGNSTMSPSTADALINAKQNGHMIFLCTGRSYNQIYPSLKAFDFDGVVAAAGGYVTVGDKVIAHHVYGQNLLQKVLDTVGDNDTGLIFQTKDKSITNHKWADKFLSAFSKQEPEPYSGEITLRGVNKATGIRDVVEFLHMSQADTIGFGDGQNDFDMLRYCDVGVAMGNSSDEVKAVADIVTDDIKEDGLKNAMVHLGLV